MKHSEALKAAKELISLPENWSKGWYYRNKLGMPVNNYQEAHCFCAYGAIRKVSQCESDYEPKGVVFLHKVVESLFSNVHTYNDTHSHAEVLVLFDKAIELAEKAGE